MLSYSKRECSRISLCSLFQTLEPIRKSRLTRLHPMSTLSEELAKSRAQISGHLNLDCGDIEALAALFGDSDIAAIM